MSTAPLTFPGPGRYNTAMKIHELFTDADIARLEKKIAAARLAALLLAAGGLAALART